MVRHIFEYVTYSAWQSYGFTEEELDFIIKCFD